ncbi:hypothetical protein G7Y89_g9909 [Cudoniella acicularis]|uniref:tyrosinase n=1 Tax=Cudoniella acicularis TaxID=354080 RepID=A0A8H4RGI4_9HELO|nr:hypothetical protein G7Y89_g9909 [Cudoniella acicularis]
MASPTPYVIKGINANPHWDPKNPTPLALRREIDDLYDESLKNSKTFDQLSLYLLALKEFHEQDYKDELSYFGVSGIHGQPFGPWNETTPAVTPGKGYCTHNSILFPTWHRPYLMLFEQRILEVIKGIIAKSAYEPARRAELIATAEQWRLPYWDFANKNKTTLAALCTKQSVEVINPHKPSAINTEGKPDRQTIANPLYRFNMPSGKTFGDAGVTRFVNTDPDPKLNYTLTIDLTNGTTKCIPFPIPEDQEKAWIEGFQNLTVVDELLSSGPVATSWTFASSTAEGVYRLLNGDDSTDDGEPRAWADFASTALQPPKGVDPSTKPLSYMNIEFIHNNMHVWVGGKKRVNPDVNYVGHLGLVPYSAFDPAFWLLHCNCDRLISIWQALHPNEWFVSAKDPSGAGTWAIGEGELLTPDTPLAPFRKEAAKFWTSNDVREWTTLGYSYPELQPWLAKNPAGQFDEVEYIRQIKADVTALYDVTGKAILGQVGKDIAQADENITKNIIPPDTIHDHIVECPIQKGDGYLEHIDYVVNVEYSKYEFNGGHPYDLEVFIHDGPISEATPDQLNKALVGTAEAGVVSCAQLPLTRRLADDLIAEEKALTSLVPSSVEDYLKANLKWRVSALNGALIPLERLPSLKLSLAQGVCRVYTSDKKVTDYKNYSTSALDNENRSTHIGGFISVA